MDTELVIRAQHADEEAFASLAVAVGDRLHAVAHRILRDTDLVLPLWTFRGVPALDVATNAGVSVLVWVVDVGTTPVIIAVDSDAPTLAAHRAEIDALVKTIQFDH